VVERSVGRTLPVELRPDRGLDRPHVFLRVERAWRELGWTPRTNLTDGVERTWRALRLKDASSPSPALPDRAAA
jgi:nucleoside-diphosphate-sugar epimerase